MTPSHVLHFGFDSNSGEGSGPSKGLRSQLKMSIMIKEIQLVGAAILILLFNHLSQAQGWKSYPYHQDGTLIYFPRDEGSHPEFQAGSGTEWWYVNMHLQGDSTQHNYSAMVAFFNYNFRIFNITDEMEQDFHSFTNFGLLSAAQECLNLKFYPFFMETERWLTKTDSLGKLVPFQYVLKVGGDNYALAVDLDAQKPPLIIGKDGLITVGSGDSYYYSQTQLVVTGTLKFKGQTEPVSGIAWIDHQYGPFFASPGGEESYEWFSLQLDNGKDINLWHIFTADDQIPQDDSHRIFTIYVDEQTQDTSSSFSLERLSFWEFRQGLYFASGWRLIEPNHKIDLVITPLFHDQVVPFSDAYFWEGSCQVAGEMNGESVAGQAFAELLHIYEAPIITLIAPNGGEQWDGSQPVTWKLENPDAGNPLTYDLFYQAASDTNYFLIAAGLKDTMFYWDVSNLGYQHSLRIKIVGHSIDSTISGSDSSDDYFSIVAGTAIENLAERDLNSYQLFQNYPNPFNQSTTIRFRLPQREHVTLKVFDVKGRVVATLMDDNCAAGNFAVSFSPRDIATSLYFYQITAGKFVQGRKAVLIR